MNINKTNKYSMRSEEFIDYQLEEDWKKTAASVGTALAIGAGSYATNKRAEPETTSKPVQPAVYVTKAPVTKSLQIPKSAPAAKVAPQKIPQAPQEHENFLRQQAEKSGITGTELTHFLTQMSHETLGFRRMTERGTPDYFAKRYDKKHAPRRAKILGNTEIGDGERYRGRGYIQLTGRYNYDRAGRALGVDLVNNPDLAADPKIAAKIAIWYWQKRVQPKISDWETATVKSVTRPINPGGKGIKSRTQHFQKIKHQKK